MANIISAYVVTYGITDYDGFVTATGEESIVFASDKLAAFDAIRKLGAAASDGTVTYHPWNARRASSDEILAAF